MDKNAKKVDLTWIHSCWGLYLSNSIYSTQALITPFDPLGEKEVLSSPNLGATGDVQEGNVLPGDTPVCHIDISLVAYLFMPFLTVCCSKFSSWFDSRGIRGGGRGSVTRTLQFSSYKYEGPSPGVLIRRSSWLTVTSAPDGCPVH